MPTEPEIHPAKSSSDGVELDSDAVAIAGRPEVRRGDDVHCTIVEESPLPLILLDRDGAVVYVSPSMPYDLGWSKAELVGYRLVDFLHPDDRERASRVMLGAAAAQRLGTAMTLRWRRRHSGYVSVEAAIRQVVGAHGEEVEGVVIALRTNPLQWSGLGEVLMAKERLRALADGADSGMAIVSGGEHTLGAVLEANTPLGRMVGITRGQLAGLPLTSLIAEDEAGRVRDALQAVAANGGTSSLEATVVPRIGRRLPVTITVAASIHSDQPGQRACGPLARQHGICEFDRGVESDGRPAGAFQRGAGRAWPHHRARSCGSSLRGLRTDRPAAARRCQPGHQTDLRRDPVGDRPNAGDDRRASAVTCRPGLRSPSERSST